jgi:ubiquinone/menaquinone biosynthesis C-methylase UbiE
MVVDPMQELKKTQYIHAMSDQDAEENRLLSQAEISKPFLWENINLKTHNLALNNPFLEVGCGVGAQTLHVKQALPAGSKVIGIDIDPLQIQKANDRVKINDISDDCSYRVMSACALDFPDDYFSGAYICWVLEHLSDSEAVAALKEVKRVVKPGGRIIINEINMAPGVGVVMQMPDGSFPFYVFKFLQQMIASQKEKGGNPCWGDVANMESFLEKAGFKDFVVQGKMMSYPIKNQDFQNSVDDGILLFKCILPILIKEKRFSEQEFDCMLDELKKITFIGWGYGQAQISVN